MITVDRVNELLSFDSQAGLFYWRVKTNRGQTNIGDIAGHIGKEGYRILVLDQRKYMAHRVIWLVTSGVWPKHCIDHINGDKLDNRPQNLREATISQNGFNRPAQANNTSGRKGVTWHKRDERWQAQIWKGGKRIHLGYFADLEEAASAYSHAARALHGEFARPE